MNINVALSCVRQVDSVAEYVAHFIKLSCCAVGWTDELLLAFFVGSLKEDIQDGILALEPKRLARAMELSQIFENKQLRRRSSFRGNTPKPSSLAPLVRNKPPFIPAGTTTKVHTKMFRGGPPVSCRTQAELQDRKQRGLCFYCNDANSHRFS